MDRLDRMFADVRAQALRAPITRANQKILPQIDLPGGIMLALSINK